MAVSNVLYVLLLLVLISIIGINASHQIYEEFQSLSVESVNRIERTGFHFQPPKHWINDPNGPVYYKGLYHLFYQYNPKGAVWGNIVWAHSVSSDLVNWEALEPALYPSKWFDIKGVWSGSTTIVPGKGPIILYTGVNQNETQLQNYAIPKDPSDPYLRKWIKPNDNPIMKPDYTVNGSAFRDPTTAWFSKDGHWRTVVGSKRNDRGIAYMYRSRDFKVWVKAKHPVHSKDSTGMWECPDLFPVSLTDFKHGLDLGYVGPNHKHVLKVSLDITRYDYYTLGKYDPKKDQYVPDSGSIDGWDGLRFDYGNFYASKTFFDYKKNRRILWGWANESDRVQDDILKGWAGLQTIPRTVVLDSSKKQLRFWPVEEIESLRGDHIRMHNQNIKMGQRLEVKGITPAQADVEVTFHVGSLEKAERFDTRTHSDFSRFAFGFNIIFQTIPRTVVLDSSKKQLRFWPVEEIESLRGDHIRMHNQNIKMGQRLEVKGITPAQADVEVTFHVGSLEKAERFDTRTHSDFSRFAFGFNIIFQTIPRTVVLDSSKKQLRFWPVEEIESLRGDHIRMHNQNIKMGQRLEVKGITPAQADVEVTFHVGSLEKAERFDTRFKFKPFELCKIKGSNVTGGVGPFGLITLATPDLEEYTPVFFRVFKDTSRKPKVLMCSDARPSSLKKDKGPLPKDKMYKPSFAGFVDVDLSNGRISLRSLIDHSVVESFGALGKTVITSRVYPVKAVKEKAHLYVFNNGRESVKVESLYAWSMNRPKHMND